MMLLAALLAASAPNCAAAMTQADMSQCAAERYRNADAALNAAWKKLMAQAGASKPAYVAAQRLWIQYRDADCAAEGKASEGGSIHGMVLSDCLAQLTEVRTRRILLLTQGH